MTTQIKESSKKYGIIREVPSHTKGDKNLKNMTEENRKKYMKQMKEDMTLVKAKFRNMEPAGGDHEMIYKKYAVDGVQTWRFKHNETYEVPLGLVNHVNENCKTSFNKLNKDGSPNIEIFQKQEFIPVSFEKTSSIDG